MASNGTDTIQGWRVGIWDEQSREGLLEGDSTGEAIRHWLDYLAGPDDIQQGKDRARVPRKAEHKGPLWGNGPALNSVVWSHFCLPCGMPGSCDPGLKS